ncbi:MAG: hypothetical protein KC516_03235 [Nanoarchaeota archaeon]|nr:hypothetical protein [Nanoarchaeota archaeon]
MTKRRKGSILKINNKKSNSEAFPKSLGEVHLRAERKHNQGIEKIIANPEIIGVKDIHFYETEINIYDGDKKLSALDIWLSNTDTCYLIEYKSRDCKGMRIKAKDQLRIAKKHIEDKYRKDKMVMLYVSNGNNVLELTEKGYFRKFP